MENNLKCLRRIFFKVKILHACPYDSNGTSLCLWIFEWCKETSPRTFSPGLQSVHFHYFPDSLQMSSAEAVWMILCAKIMEDVQLSVIVRFLYKHH